MQPVLFIVEDDDVLRQTLSEVFSKRGLVFSVDNGADALAFVKANRVDIVLLDLRLPDMNGLAVLKGIHEEDDDIMVIVVTAYPEVRTAISAMKAGAYDYINKPFELEELKILVDKAIEAKRLKSELEILRYQKGDECFYNRSRMVGDSPAFKVVKKLIDTVCKTSKTSVLIQGETGTGKELVAKAVHCLSERGGGPFIKINCSAIPETLLESELFGYEKGSFTDAKQGKKGLFELADGGTIFLDEIGDMDVRLQPKLLEVLEYQTFRKVGGVRDIRVDVRVVAATNRDIEALIKERKFREDLYYRLKVFVIALPPLRERKEDIIPLVEYFIQVNNKDNKSFGKGVKKLSPKCRDLLLNYPWPGNVRELKNIVERAMMLSDSSEILPEHLSRELIDWSVSIPHDNAHPAEMTEMTIEQMEKAHILQVLAQCNYNKTMASKLLGISRMTLREKLKKYSIEND